MNSKKRIVKILKQNKKLFLILLSVFIICFIAGLLYPNLLAKYQQELTKYIINMVEGKSPLEITLFIIFNNLRSSFLAILFGFLFAIVPAITLVFNGYFAGAVSAKAIEKAGSSLILFNLLPHGIFEIPAIILAITMGVRIGINTVQNKDIKQSYKDAFLIFLYIILPLLVIAGIIEGILFSLG